MEKTKWFRTAMGCLIISGLSMLISVVVYIDARGFVYNYSLGTLIMGDDFLHRVLWWYSGPVLWEMGGATVQIITAIAAVSLLCAVVGLITLRAQRPNLWQFRLTVVGLVGTCIPSLLLIAAAIMSRSYFKGTIIPGVSPILTPIAMGLSIRVVIRRKNTVQEQLQAELRQKGLIRPGGDL